MQGYCVRCRAKQEMLSATRTLMKNGRRAMVGVCGCCGTKLWVIGKWDDDQETENLTDSKANGTDSDGNNARIG